MNLLAFLVAAATLAAPHSVPPQPAAKISKPIQLAMMCMKTGENSPPGSMTKICFYNCLGSEVAITISNVEICPLSIDR